MSTQHCDVLILGAGIGGHQAFVSLHNLFKKHGIKKRITILDKNNYFTFVPMLHEVASGSVQANQCAIPIRECVHNTPHEFLQATVEHIDIANKSVQTSSGTFTYDYVVIALGSNVNFFGTKGADEYTYTVRTLPQAISLHQKFVSLLEDDTKKEITISIVGGGATGVEVAGQFAHLAKKDIHHLYPEKKVTVQLFQSSPTLVPYLHSKVQRFIMNKLASLDVKIFCDTKVTQIHKDTISLEKEEKQSDLTIWTAGFSYAGATYLDELFTEKGQIVVNEYMHIPDHQTAYVIGDIAAAKHPSSDTPQPKLAQWAEAQASYVANHLISQIKQTSCSPFTYKDKGSLIPIGDWYATAHIGTYIFEGKFAWWLRRTVYLKSVPGFVRKLRIVIDWTLHGLGFRHFIDIDSQIKTS